MMGGENAQDDVRRETRREAGSSGKLALFLRSTIFDYLLVLVISAGLVFTVSYGFNSAPDLRGNVAVIAVACGVLLAALYVGQWSKRMMPIAAVAYVLCSAVVIFIVSALSPEQVPLFADNQVNDVESNYAVFAMVLVIVPLFVFLLSRRTWSVFILLFAGAVTCGSVQFLYRDWIQNEPGTLAAIVVFVGIGALLVVQGYRRGILTSQNVRKTSFGMTFAFGVTMACACVAIGAGLFYAVVAGLGLSTVDAKPFQDYYSRPIVEYDGTYEQQEVIDPDLGTSVLSDDEEDTIDDAEGDTSEEEEEESGGGFSLTMAVVNILNPDDWSNVFDPVRFDVPPSLIVLLALLPIVIILAIILLRRHVRVRRLRKLEQLDNADRVVWLYNFFLNRFKRLKVERDASWTPLEFALAQGQTVSGFADNPSKTDFLAVTLLYQRAAYGARNIDDAEYKTVRDYYESFFRNARKRVGYLKWAFKYFWRI